MNVMCWFDFIIQLSASKAPKDDLVLLAEGQESNWEVVERILFIYAKLNPGHGYVQASKLS